MLNNWAWLKFESFKTLKVCKDTVNTVDKDLVTNETIDKELEVQALENVEDE